MSSYKSKHAEGANSKALAKITNVLMNCNSDGMVLTATYSKIAYKSDTDIKQNASSSSAGTIHNR
jgi:hypothetical protein